MAGAEMLGERLTHPAPFVAARHPVAAEQFLLALERQPGDLPADREPLEQELRAALPAVLSGGGRLRVKLLELPQRAGAQLVAEREHVALGVAVVGRAGGCAARATGRAALRAPARTPSHGRELARSAQNGGAALLDRRCDAVGDAWVQRSHRTEVLLGQDDRASRRRRDYGRIAHRVADDAHLAEEIPGSQLVDALAV